MPGTLLAAAIIEDVRIAIIGGGIIGCATAWRLARAGAAVTVFEPRGIGAGATQASAGALVPYVEAHEPSPLQDLTVRSLGLYDHFIDELQTDSRRPVDYARCGSLEVAFTEEDERALQSVARRHATAGVRWIDAAETLRLEPALTPAIRGSLAVADHGYVSAPQLTTALADAAGQAGTIFREARVTAVQQERRTAGVATDAGAVEEFDRVIVANGAWARLLDLADSPRMPVRPVKGQLLRLRGMRVTQLLWSRACYIVPQATGEILVGATMEDAGFDERATVAGVAELMTAGMGLLPSIGQGEFTDVRVGLRPATTDGLPIIGYARGSESVLYAVGHFRNGVVLAPLTARILTDLILDNLADPALAMLSPARFGL